MKGTYLEQLTWTEAETALTERSVVLIPLGAAAKEHGPHLRLDNDRSMAEYLARRIAVLCDVVVVPTVAYHHYPAFTEYPGSISLRPETARDLIADICLSLARHGPRRFYVLNTGVSTIRPLREAAGMLAGDGILLHFTDFVEVLGAAAAGIAEQEGGSHADEVETSMMLYIDPDNVDMDRAEKDYHPRGAGGLTRSPEGEGAYSSTGIFGDATLAAREKGEKIVEALIKRIVRDIDTLRSL